MLRAARILALTVRGGAVGSSGNDGAAGSCELGSDANGRDSAIGSDDSDDTDAGGGTTITVIGTAGGAAVIGAGSAGCSGGRRSGSLRMLEATSGCGKRSATSSRTRSLLLPRAARIS